MEGGDGGATVCHTPDMSVTVCHTPETSAAARTKVLEFGPQPVEGVQATEGGSCM